MQAEAWVRTHRNLTGPLELVQREPWASVFTAPAEGGAVWLKACAPVHAFEVGLTAALAARHPGVVSEVLAHDAERRWLLMADAGERLGDLGNLPTRWLEILPRYAELQIAETPHAAEHLAGGVPDLRTARLPELVEVVLRAELPIDADERAALAEELPRFAARCADLDAAGVGQTIQHDDLHMHNVYLRNCALRVLDWGDASVAHPFCSLLETFRFLREQNRLAPADPWFGRLRDAYLEAWGPGHGAAFDLALRIAGIAQTVAYQRLREALPASDRPEFDRSFAVLLRRELRRARDG